MNEAVIEIANSIYHSPQLYNGHSTIVLGELKIEVVMEMIRAFEIIASEAGESDSIILEMHSDYSASITQELFGNDALENSSKTLLSIDKVVLNTEQ